MIVAVVRHHLPVTISLRLSCLIRSFSRGLHAKLLLADIVRIFLAEYNTPGNMP